MNYILRVILTLVLLLALVGFGVCGAMGTLGGLSGISGPSTGGELGNMAPAMLGYGLVGLAIAAVCWYAIVKLWRQRPPGSR